MSHSLDLSEHFMMRYDVLIHTQWHYVTLCDNSDIECTLGLYRKYIQICPLCSMISVMAD